MRVVAQDERNASAWLWLSGVVDSMEDREVCLENVLAVDPDNAAARRGLEWVREQIAAQAPPIGEGAPPFSVPVEPAAEAESPLVARTRTPISPAAAILRDGSSEVEEPPLSESVPSSSVGEALYADFSSRQLPPESEPEPEPTVPVDEFDDEYLCPYCAELTEPDDRGCKACGGDLWIKFRKREKRSTTFWLLLLFQLINVMQLAALPVLLLGYVFALLLLESIGSSESLTVLGNPLALVNLYLGLDTTLPPAIQQAALDLVPRFVFLLSFLPVSLSLVVLVGLAMRLKAFYYLLLLDALFGLVAAIGGYMYHESMISLAIGIILALVRFVMIFSLEDEFILQRRRILLETDRGLGSYADFLARADFYNKRKMWALAALHLRGATGYVSDRLDSRLALAVAYIRLKRSDLADRELAEAERISPDDPRIEKLAALVAEMRSKDDPSHHVEATA
jgi:hypothetical protein